MVFIAAVHGSSDTTMIEEYKGYLQVNIRGLRVMSRYWLQGSRVCKLLIDLVNSLDSKDEE
jgi:hypothetical protein